MVEEIVGYEKSVFCEKKQVLELFWLIGGFEFRVFGPVVWVCGRFHGFGVV